MEIRGDAFPEPDGHAPAPGGPAVRPQPYEGTWRFTAPVRDSSVPRARHLVRDLLRRRGAPVSDELLHGLLLILSELVTNAVRHAALLSEEIGVEVAVGPDWVRIGVEDGHPYRPSAPPADPAREHTGGRGLLLVEATVTEAGGIFEVHRTASGGKVVWAVLPMGRRPAGGPGSPAR
ncbi:ATP-binding protein [Streptomyces glaucosporus]|uniref:ATP-binding protein n=1 Tax=Streptomyces glaucosporus TaxID=284044 RepID=A0ABN3IK39_9ACTN